MTTRCSLDGWRLQCVLARSRRACRRFSGNLPLRIWEVCSLTVTLLFQPSLYVAAGIVRWVRGEEYGVETLVLDDESRDDLEDYLVWCIDHITEPGL
jgi:hypothetical protein